MSNIKIFQKYLILIGIWLASMFLIFMLTKQHFMEIEQDDIPSIDAGSIREAEIKIIHQDLKQQSKDIMHLLEFVSTINKANIQKDKYSRVLIPLMNMHHLMYTEYLADISVEIDTVKAFAGHDVVLSKIFSKDLPQNIHGLKYFQQNFNKLVREVRSTKLLPQDTQFEHFVKKHIMPYIVYISPNGSSMSRNFSEAQTYLEVGNMKEFYSALQRIESNNAMFKEYMVELQKLLTLQEAINEAKVYIQDAISRANDDVEVADVKLQ